MYNVRTQIEQIKKMNEGCGNGFKIDINTYNCLKTKQLIKHIKIDEKHILQAKLSFLENREGFVPTLSLSIWEEKVKGILFGDCKTQYITLGEPRKRRNFKLLQEYSNKITNDIILKSHNTSITSKINILYSDMDVC